MSHRPSPAIRLVGIAVALSVVSVFSVVGAEARTARRPALAKGVATVRRTAAVSKSVPTNWLTALNYYRALANLPAVPNNTNYTVPNTNHSHYMWRWQELRHDEDDGEEFATPEGEDAGLESNVLLGQVKPANFGISVTGWMTAPFHGLGMIDPRLLKSGFGFWNQSGKPFKYAATLTVTDTEDGGYNLGTPDPLLYPILWPADNKVLPVNSYDGGESPDPLVPCTGYVGTEPTGTPLIVQLSNDNTPLARGTYTTTLTKGSSSTNIAHCTYDGFNSSLDANAQNVMKSRDAVFIIPKQPLASGATYHVSLTWLGNLTPITWDFKVADLLAPVTRITVPVKRRRPYDQDTFHAIKGTSTGNASKVEVALAMLMHGTGKCKFWTGSGFGSPRNCNNEKWLRARGTDNWSLRINRTLPQSYFLLGQKPFNYIARSRGTDAAQNVETRFTSGRNNNFFHLKP